MSANTHPDAVHVASMPTFSLEELHADARQLRDTLTAAGITIPTSSRVWQYLSQLDLLEQAARDGTLERAPDMRVLHHGVAELLELVVIVQELSRPPAVAAWAREVERLLGDAAAPSPREPRTPSRDLQFQLWLAAVSRKAGYEISLAEPDVILRDGEFALGLAAKRLRSVAKLDMRFKKASLQVARSGHPGIVAMDLSVLFNPGYGTIVVAEPEHTLKVVGNSARGFAERNIRRIAHLVDRRHVVGLLVVAKGLFLVEGSRLAPAHHVEWKNLCRVDDSRYPGFVSLVRRFGEAATK